MVVVDGWGIDVSWRRRGISEQSIPNLNFLWHNYPHSALQSLDLLRGSYPYVDDVSVAYETLALGQLVKQPAAIVSDAIQNRTFFQNPSIGWMVENCAQKKSTLHLVGHIANARPYSYIEHLEAIIRLASMRGVARINCHLLVDDGAFSGMEIWLPKLNAALEGFSASGIASLSGSAAGAADIASAVTGRTKNRTDNLSAYLAACAVKNIRGANISPVVNVPIAQENPWQDENGVFFFDLSVNPTMAQIASILADPGASRRYLGNARVIAGTLTDYQIKPQVRIAFREKPSTSHLLQTIVQNQRRVLLGAISPMEKMYSRYFNALNNSFPQGVAVKSLHTSDELEPAAQAVSRLVTDTGKIMGNYDFTIISIPLMELAGRTGDMRLLELAARYSDREVTRIVKYITNLGGGVVIISPHAGYEAGDGQNMKHSNGPVPFILVAGDRARNLVASATSYYAQSGFLADIIQAKHMITDIAPTVLSLLNLPVPPNMTGNNIIASI